MVFDPQTAIPPPATMGPQLPDHSSGGLPPQLKYAMHGFLGLLTYFLGRKTFDDKGLALAIAGLGTGNRMLNQYVHDEEEKRKKFEEQAKINGQVDGIMKWLGQNGVEAPESVIRMAVESGETNALGPWFDLVESPAQKRERELREKEYVLREKELLGKIELMGTQADYYKSQLEREQKVDKIRAAFHDSLRNVLELRLQSGALTPEQKAATESYIGGLEAGVAPEMVTEIFNRIGMTEEAVDLSDVEKIHMMRNALPDYLPWGKVGIRITAENFDDLKIDHQYIELMVARDTWNRFVNLAGTKYPDFVNAVKAREEGDPTIYPLQWTKQMEDDFRRIADTVKPLYDKYYERVNPTTWPGTPAKKPSPDAIPTETITTGADHWDVVRKNLTAEVEELKQAREIRGQEEAARGRKIMETFQPGVAAATKMFNLTAGALGRATEVLGAPIENMLAPNPPTPEVASQMAATLLQEYEDFRAKPRGHQAALIVARFGDAIPEEYRDDYVNWVLNVINMGGQQ